jgi:hypothetical protein
MPSYRLEIVAIFPGEGDGAGPFFRWAIPDIACTMVSQEDGATGVFGAHDFDALSWKDAVARSLEILQRELKSWNVGRGRQTPLGRLLHGRATSLPVRGLRLDFTLREGRSPGRWEAKT